MFIHIIYETKKPIFHSHFKLIDTWIYRRTYLFAN